MIKACEQAMNDLSEQLDSAVLLQEEYAARRHEIQELNI
jgi:hypothetical protein